MLRKYATPLLFADDTSVIISSPNKTEFKEILSQVLNAIAKWCNNKFTYVKYRKNTIHAVLYKTTTKNRHSSEYI
jgi:hypothetical protein